jgi:hypothetical protein
MVAVVVVVVVVVVAVALAVTDRRACTTVVERNREMKRRKPRTLDRTRPGTPGYENVLQSPGGYTSLLTPSLVVAGLPCPAPATSRSRCARRAAFSALIRSSS